MAAAGAVLDMMTTYDDNIRKYISTTSNLLLAVTAFPYSDSSPLDCVAATEGAAILGMLANLNLLHDLPERRTISCGVLADNSDLLRALGLHTSLSHSIHR